jgi:membrane protease subunit (stomatin/prohibitin family)
MGFIRNFVGGIAKATGGAIGGTLADQWKDFFKPRIGVVATAAMFEAVKEEQNAGRGIHGKGLRNVITNGSRFVVPEGTALITMENGAITGLIAEPGGYTFTSKEQNSQSLFAGDDLLASTIKTSWERFKFNGVPGSQQVAFYINLREIPNNRFGTQSEVYWDDAFFGTQVGAITRGTYTLKIIDPILFVKQFVPAKYLMPGAPIFDFADMDNDAGSQLFSEVVSSLAAAFSNYTNDPNKGNRISRIQGDAVGFGQALSKAVDEAFHWQSDRGLTIEKVAIQAIEYDEDTKALLSDVRRADAMMGARGNSMMQQSVARGFEAAGSNPHGAGMAFMGMGMGMNTAGGMMPGMQQPVDQQSFVGQQQTQQSMFHPQMGQPVQQQPMFDPHTGQPIQQQAPVEDQFAKLASLKGLLDQGVITQEDFDAAKSNILGI